MENPWEKMHVSSVRRIDFESIHNLFWMIDLEGNYGLLLKADKSLIEIDNSIKLKGIKVIKRNSQSNDGELYLFLNQKSDWSIFYMLCKDIIRICNLFNSHNSMIGAVEMRLKRWQLFLMNDIKFSL